MNDDTMALIYQLQTMNHNLSNLCTQSSGNINCHKKNGVFADSYRVFSTTYHKPFAILQMNLDGAWD